MRSDIDVALGRNKPPKGNPLNLATAEGEKCPDCRTGVLVLHRTAVDHPLGRRERKWDEAHLTCTRCRYRYDGIAFQAIPDEPEF